MTYEEREKQICRECSMKETCPYIPRKMEYKCQNLSDMMYGWELGYKDAVNKACEWLFEYNKRQTKRFGAKSVMRLPDYTINVGDFHKAMEEQK